MYAQASKIVGRKRNDAPTREKKMLSKEERKSQQRLEFILDRVCKMAGRNAFLMLPEREEDRIEFLKKEISETLDLI
tara:strand:+ start:271 stop:501 length:231 start_codon:yes stop_codon:yes gene_type:complete